MPHRPATHTGVLILPPRGYNAAPVRKTVRLNENAKTWRDVETGQLYSKETGCVRPCNIWDSRTLDLDTILPDA